MEIHRFDTVTSTMDYARTLHVHGARDFTVVVADQQSTGRGRSGHAWHSPPGDGAYISALLYPRLPAAHGAWLTMIGALAVLDAVHAVAPALRSISGLKWFNDVLLGEHKLAGVLLESALVGEHFEYAVLGIGVNINTDFAAAPADLRARATSLRAVLGTQVDREQFIDALLANLQRRYAQIHTGQSPLSAYAKEVRTLGKAVQIQIGDAQLDGIARAIADDGALLIETPAGTRRVSAGVVM
jgi:BirA family transcriptional regulator, biotin operon repressor / biotin---[acetyl-CoA-carboxylase] ligase